MESQPQTHTAMAASATVRGATSHFSPQYHLLHSTNNPAVSRTFAVLLPKAISKPIRRRLLVVRRSGGDVSAETTTSETTESEAPVDVRKEPSSLISALNVEKALRGIGKQLSIIDFGNIRIDEGFKRKMELIIVLFYSAAITDVDHYGRLGLRRGCSYDQVWINDTDNGRRPLRSTEDSNFLLFSLVCCL